MIGDPKIVFEMDVDIDVRRLEYERSIARFDDRKILAQRYLDNIDVNEQSTGKERITESYFTVLYLKEICLLSCALIMEYNYNIIMI